MDAAALPRFASPCCIKTAQHDRRCFSSAAPGPFSAKTAGCLRAARCTRRSTRANTEDGQELSRAEAEEAQEVWEVRGSTRQQMWPVRLLSEEDRDLAGAENLRSTRSTVVDSLRALFIPRGYPDSVTSDYLPYQIGWIEASLATSSLLKAVGFGAGPVGAAAATAGIKWILKDGIGAAGRLFVGGSLSGYFDEEPRKWRMTGELLNTVGTAMEIATTLYPQAFLLLAGGGTLAKSIGKGMGKPAFRVIQQHFSVRNNVGDVAAKEEVWEVAGQMSGLAATVAILMVLDAHPSVAALLLTWGLFTTAHVYLRLLSLKMLRFTGLNQKRACILVRRHAAGQQLPGVDEVNVLEPVLPPRETVSPRVRIGCSFDEAMAGYAPNRVLDIYSSESYVLTWRGGEGRVVLKVGHQDIDKIRALWQAAWLEHHGTRDASLDDLERSLMATGANWNAFLSEAEGAGWNLGDILIRTPDVLIATGQKDP